jgi:hypothetical protein
MFVGPFKIDTQAVSHLQEFRPESPNVFWGHGKRLRDIRQVNTYRAPDSSAGTAQSEFEIELFVALAVPKERRGEVRGFSFGPKLDPNSSIRDGTDCHGLHRGIGDNLAKTYAR